MRISGLDIFRGFAILLMITFHLSFDLDNFNIVDFDVRRGEFWKYFRYLIVSIFVFSAGISLILANKEEINFFKVKRRVIVLSFASLLVSIGSYTQFPNTWIYFGILHFFLFASIVGLLFLRFPKTSLFLGIFIILGYAFSIINMHWLFDILKTPLHLPTKNTEDLATIFPWFGVFLLGMAFGNFGLHTVIFNNRFFNSPSRANRVLSYLGKNSLVIYLIHQPILFSIFLTAQYFGFI
ncbi:DUF1624 domain-containing protein [Sulfurimonas aquatica]|uniref:DUF1624 domain-containing protein n=1 Tax=Sulfurimonas aquatica TaxID=2672570 RepID=A0A975B1N2_9BACT|nr:heparan-alpha-glucosaminide N-acetyltransferase [Sulfurimonas aquatica]QSZ42468.1 DUF1624 domain-containing protein [Sulfurimonas aquatica]